MGGKSSIQDSCDVIAQSDLIIVLGGRVSCDNEALYHTVVNAANNGAKVIYMHPLEDVLMDSIITQMIKYEAGSEEGVVAMLAKTLLDGHEISDAMQHFLCNLDEGYLCAESNVGEEEFQSIFEIAAASCQKTLVIGYDIFNHKKSSNIAKICGVIDSSTSFSVFIDSKYGEEKDVEMLNVSQGGILDPISPLPEYNGTIVYKCYPNKQFNNDLLQGSGQFAIAARLNNGDLVTIDGYDGTKKFLIDETLKGTIALNVLDAGSNRGYRFEKIKITRVGS